MSLNNETNPIRLYEILVPTKMSKCDSKGRIFHNKPQVPVKTKHHKRWDAFVHSISGGLTLLTPGRGQWIDKNMETLYCERVIPVRIACTEEQMKLIAAFTTRHYRQLSVMYYELSNKVYFT